MVCREHRNHRVEGLRRDGVIGRVEKSGRNALMWWAICGGEITRMGARVDAPEPRSRAFDTDCEPLPQLEKEIRMMTNTISLAMGKL